MQPQYIHTIPIQPQHNLISTTSTHSSKTISASAHSASAHSISTKSTQSISTTNFTQFTNNTTIIQKYILVSTCPDHTFLYETVSSDASLNDIDIENDDIDKS